MKHNYQLQLPSLMNVIKVVLVLMPQYFVLTEALFILSWYVTRTKFSSWSAALTPLHAWLWNLQDRGFEQKQPQAAQISIPGQSVCLWATGLGSGAELRQLSGFDYKAEWLPLFSIIGPVNGIPFIFLSHLNALIRWETSEPVPSRPYTVTRIQSPWFWLFKKKNIICTI